MDNVKKVMGERLRQVRGNLTQAAFAESLGFSQSYIADIEVGRTKPGIELLKAVCEKYGVTIDWLILGVESTLKHQASSAPDGVQPYSEGRSFDILIDKLVKFYNQADEDTKAWTRVQLKRSFPDILTVIGE